MTIFFSIYSNDNCACQYHQVNNEQRCHLANSVLCVRIQAVCEISIPSQSFVYSSSPASLHQRRVQRNASHLPYRIWCAPPSYPLSENHIRFFLRTGRVCQRLSFFSPPEHHYMQRQPERQRTTRHGTSIGENPPRDSPCLLASLLTDVVCLCASSGKPVQAAHPV